MDDIAPMIVLVTGILTIGSVLIFRPLSKRLSELLEVYTREKSASQMGELRRMRETVETLEARLRLVEERQDFTDRLLDGPPERSPAGQRPVTRDPERLPPPGGDSAGAA